MWSVWNWPNGGSFRIDARTSSLTGVALRSTVNSRGPSVMQRLYIRSLPGFRLDKRGLDHFTFKAAAADIHRHWLAVGDGGAVDVSVIQRKRDADFQSRREGSRCRDADRAVSVEDGEVRPQYPAAESPQPAQHALGTRLLLRQQRVASPERVLLPADRPSAGCLQRRDLQ